MLDGILQIFGDEVIYICVGSEEDAGCHQARLNVQVILKTTIAKYTPLTFI